MITTAPAPETTVEETAVDRPSPASSSEPISNGAPERVPDEVQNMIEVAAYYIAQRRGFEPGHEIDDWLAAQAQVFDLLAQSED